MVAGTTDESVLIAALRAGDQQAFAQLVDAYAPAMLRVARGYVSNRQTAEEVVQDTWIALIRGISTFEARSSLKTWLFAVMANIAKARGLRESRDRDHLALTGATVDSARFHGPNEPGAGSWKEAPAAIPDTPEDTVLGRELRVVTQAELDKLPEQQRAVVTLRDMLEFSSTEVCGLLNITPANQRVLLHRGRAAIRSSLDDYVKCQPSP